MRQVHIEVLLIAKTHLYDVVVRWFSVVDVQSFSVPYLSKVGTHRFFSFDFLRREFELMSIELV